ncbi:MAG: hypothetical protein RIQ79_173, partial [Verrucomicrobiota bacterium]
NSGQRIEILEGLSLDSAVILNPNSLLQDGQPVP